MMQMLMARAVSEAVGCLARLGIPDLIEGESKSAEELAKQLSVHPQALYRLLRATASAGVLMEGPDGRFSQTPLSAVLCSAAKPSLRAAAMLYTSELFSRG